MDVGRKLRAIRRQKKITLQQIADGTELSKSFVSEIEAGKANPTISSLKKITSVLGVPLAALFEGVTDEGEAVNSATTDVIIGAMSPEVAQDVRVVRKDRRKMLVWPDSAGETYLITPDLKRKLEVLLSIEKPGETRHEEPYAHIGEECGLVLEGRYEVTIGERVYVLEEGDSIYFPSHLPHSTRVLDDRPATTLWVITPPSF